MKGTGKSKFVLASAATLAVISFAPLTQAKDIDIYKVESAQNAAVTVDNSGSMNTPVYEHSIDYQAMYEYLAGQSQSSVHPGYRMEYFRGSGSMLKFFERKKIYLTIPSSYNSFYLSTDKTRGLPADQQMYPGGVLTYAYEYSEPNFIGACSSQTSANTNIWYDGSREPIDTHTIIDDDGNLAPSGDGTQRLTKAADGTVLFDGQPLPYTQNIKEHDYTQLKDGTKIDGGFAGRLQAPGSYASGYKKISPNQSVGTGRTDNTYFFVTGNLINLYYVAQMHYKSTTTNTFWHGTGNKHKNKDAIVFLEEDYPIGADSQAPSWPAQSYALSYPDGGGNYANNVSEAASKKTVSQLGATKMQVHFSMVNLGAGTDRIILKDSSDNQVGTPITAASNTTTGFWSDTITGSSVNIHLESDGSGTGLGYTIDRVRSINSDNYRLQRRIDAAKDALKTVVDAYGDKISWGISEYNGRTGPHRDEAELLLLRLDPTQSGAARRNAVKASIDGIHDGIWATPTSNAVQTAWKRQFNEQKTLIDSVDCRKNIIINFTDGYPSPSEDYNHVTLITGSYVAHAGHGNSFADWDNDGWIADPGQSSIMTVYYDDITRWMFEYSWLHDGAPVAGDKANSSENVTVHNVAFGAKQELLQNASDDINAVGGTSYTLMANNRQQLIAAFNEIASAAATSVSFVAPTPSSDADNRLDSGDDVYFGLFLPKTSGPWSGNLKKYKMGDGSAARPKLFTIYSNSDNGGKKVPATNADGTFKSDVIDYWGGDNGYGSGTHNTEDDGVGEVLLKAVNEHFSAGAAHYYDRKIFTATADPIPVKKVFDQSIDPVELGLAAGDTATKNKIVNFTYGYTYDAQPSGAPVAARDWVLGAIVHSSPVMIEYYDESSPSLPVSASYVAVGANDGMLHVFDNATGQEVFAFIPQDQLARLQNIPQATELYDTVDGSITVYRRKSGGSQEVAQPKYLIFGERRGGNYYWCLDISDPNPDNWTVKWSYNGKGALGETWSSVITAKLPVAVSSAGEVTYKDVAVFSGGYDNVEDNFPEPFDDTDGDGTPFTDNAQTLSDIEGGEWSAGSLNDVNGNNQYDLKNPTATGGVGCGIYVVDIDDPEAPLTLAGLGQVLPFSVAYGSTAVASGHEQKRDDMLYSFPASPSVLSYSITDAESTVASNVLKAVYANDIYANLFKVRYNVTPKKSGTGWILEGTGWKVDKLFATDAAYKDNMAGVTASTGDVFAQGRKTFYSPEISWGGSKKYFTGSNLAAEDAAGEDVAFDGRGEIATAFYGTGDREHPLYKIVRNRIYSIYDDTAVRYSESGSASFSDFTGAAYNEKQLMNLSCDELDAGTTITDCYLGASFANGATCSSVSADADTKKWIRELLRDDATAYTGGGNVTFEKGSGGFEDDFKGWYIVLEDQGATYCGNHVHYLHSKDPDRDNHKGESINSRPSLYNSVLYLNSYQPSGSSECATTGNAFMYSLNYNDATAKYDYNNSGDKDNGVEIHDVFDRYTKFTGIQGIPSGFSFVIRKGRVVIVTVIGGKMTGVKPTDLKVVDGSSKSGEGEGGFSDDFNSANPLADGEGTGSQLGFESDDYLGIQLYYWRDSNSLDAHSTY